MHRTLCGWEYYVLLKESQVLLNTRLHKVYQISDKLFRFDFDKLSLMICVGEYFYITNTPPKPPQNPSPLAMVLRKHVGSKFLESFKQHENDRIYVLHFSNNYKLVLEQFSKGNMFLIDENDRLIQPYTFKPSPNKVYVRAQKYEFAKSPCVHMLQNEADFTSFVAENKQKSISSSLGKLSFGKIYTNDILDVLDISKDTPCEKITSTQKNALISQISNMQKSTRFFILKSLDTTNNSANPSNALKTSLSTKNNSTANSSNDSAINYELSLRPLANWGIHQEFDSFSLTVENFVQLGFDKAQVPKSNPNKVRLEIRLRDQQKMLDVIDLEINALDSLIKTIQSDMPNLDSMLKNAKKDGKKTLVLKSH